MFHHWHNSDSGVGASSSQVAADKDTAVPPTLLDDSGDSDGDSSSDEQEEEDDAGSSSSSEEEDNGDGESSSEEKDSNAEGAVARGKRSRRMAGTTTSKQAKKKKRIKKAGSTKLKRSKATKMNRNKVSSHRKEAVFVTDDAVSDCTTGTSQPVMGGNPVQDAFETQGHFTFTSAKLIATALLLVTLVGTNFLADTIDINTLTLPMMTAAAATTFFETWLPDAVQENIAGNTIQMSLVQASYRRLPSNHKLRSGLSLVLALLPLIMLEVGPNLNLAFAALGVYGEYHLVDFKILITAPGNGLQILHADAMLNGIVMLFFLTDSSRTHFLEGCGAWFIKIKAWLSANNGGLGAKLGQERQEKLWLRELLYQLLQKNPIGGTFPAGAVLLFPAFMLHFAPANVKDTLRLVAFLYFEAKRKERIADLGAQMFSWLLHASAATDETDLPTTGQAGKDAKLAEYGDMYAINRRHRANEATTTSCERHLVGAEAKQALPRMAGAGREIVRVVALHPNYRNLVFPTDMPELSRACVALLTEVGLYSKHFYLGNFLDLHTVVSQELTAEAAPFQIVAETWSMSYLLIIYFPWAPLTVRMSGSKAKVVPHGSAYTLEGAALRSCQQLTLQAQFSGACLITTFKLSKLAHTEDVDGV